MLTLLEHLEIKRPIYWYVPNAKNGGQKHEMLGYDAEYARDTGYGLFFVVNELGDQPNAKNHLRHAGNVVRFTSVFADFDDGTKQEQMERIDRFPLRPTAIIESGRGYHVYWKICGVIDPLRWSFVQTRVAETLGGDTACSDPARLMRLPETWHTKGEHVLVETIYMDAGTVYDFSLFERMWSYQEPRAFTSSRVGRRDQYRLPSMILTPNHRHPELKKVTAHLFRGCLPSDVLDRTNALKAWYLQSCQPLKAEWEEEVEEMVQWILDREGL